MVWIGHTRMRDTVACNTFGALQVNTSNGELFSDLRVIAIRTCIINTYKFIVMQLLIN